MRSRFDSMTPAAHLGHRVGVATIERHPAEPRFANIRVFTGRQVCGREVVALFEGLACRGFELGEAVGRRLPFTLFRPRAMALDIRMYSANPKDWPA